jgi:hypothetical protein
VGVVGLVMQNGCRGFGILMSCTSFCLCVVVFSLLGISALVYFILYSCYSLPTGWMDDSVFLRTRNEMEDEAWGPGISGGGGPGADSYSHRAFTTGRRKMLPQQQQVQVSGHPHTSRKVGLIIHLARSN